MRIPVQNTGRVAAAIMFLLSCLTMNAEGAVFRIEPSITLAEEYNDNIFLDQKRVDSFITRLAPSVHVKYTTSFWDWDLNYTYIYYYYTRHHLENDYTHLLTLRNRTELLKDNLYVEVRDDYSRVSENVSVDYTQQSPSANQTDQNIFVVNPYLILRPSTTSRVILGYIFQDIRYLNSSIVNQFATVNHTDHIGYADTAIDLSSRMTFTAGVRYTSDRNYIENFTQYDVYAGPQYTYAENSFIYVRGGESWFDFEPKNDSRHAYRDFWFWDAGITHRISLFSLNLNTRRFIVTDPTRVVTREDQHSASISYTGQRAVVTLAGYLSQFRDERFDVPISNSQSALGTVLYRVTPTTNATLGVRYDDVQDKTDPNGNALVGTTRILSSNARIDHALSLKATLSFEYRYVDSMSNDIPIHNYTNNRYILEYRQLF
jgi:hypothetical protein